MLLSQVVGLELEQSRLELEIMQNTYVTGSSLAYYTTVLVLGMPYFDSFHPASDKIIEKINSACLNSF